MMKYKTPFLLFLMAACLITLFSCCSWIYPLQPHDDANVYMSIGKSMLSGKLLYTEVHDHKGPLLFFLHEWAAALSSRSFFGIYLLEVFCCFGYLMFSYKTMRMFAEHGISLKITCVVGILTYTSNFMFYGDTVEELSLPILLYILYKTLRYAKYSELPRNRESILIGTGIAAIFWMKFTVLALCFGALTVLLILAWQRSQMMLLLQCLTWVVAGAAGLTAGILIYFVIHGNEADLYNSYFYFNIFLYANRTGGTPEAWWYLPLKWVGWILLIGFVLSRRMSHDVKQAIAFCWGAELLSFIFIKIYTYYFFTIFVFAPLLIYFIRNIRSQIIITTGALVLTLLATATNFNLMTLLTGNFPRAVLPLAEIINADKDPEKEVLTVNSYDTGIYTLTDCLPPIKYFYTPNTYLEELVVEQTDYLKSCRGKYLIQKESDFVGYYGTFHPDLLHDYYLIQEESDVYRPELIVNPLQYLWSLGYMRGLIERFYTPEHCFVTYRLYRCKYADAAEHAAEQDSLALIGEWKLNSEKKHFILSFSKYGLIRYQEFIDDEQKKDVTYSYIYHKRNLKLGYMFTGETYETIKVVKQSANKLVFRNWPKRGECTFIKQ